MGSAPDLPDHGVRGAGGEVGMVGIQDESSHATVRWLARCRYANAAIVLSSPRDSAGTIPAPSAVSAAITYKHPIRMSWSKAGEGAKLLQRGAAFQVSAPV